MEFNFYLLSIAFKAFTRGALRDSVRQILYIDKALIKYLHRYITSMKLIQK